jgi:hypothetical protein
LNKGFQPDLFGAARDAIPPWPEARCGNCVSRNAHIDKPMGDCPFLGPRHTNEAACANWFSTRLVNEWMGKLLAKVHAQA